MNLRNVMVSACILFGLNAIADSKNPAETYTISPNPVIWADVPDPDVIRVGDDFYMVSTTMHLMPGCPIMHSKDLVNWEIINYVFDTLEDSPRYHLEGGTVYGKGQWATSLRYHDGMFYVLFSPNDAPFQSYILQRRTPGISGNRYAEPTISMIHRYFSMMMARFTYFMVPVLSTYVN